MVGGNDIQSRGDVLISPKVGVLAVLSHRVILQHVNTTVVKIEVLEDEDSGIFLYDLRTGIPGIGHTRWYRCCRKASR